MEKGAEQESIRKLYPELSEKELQLAEENLGTYARLAERILDRIEKDPTAVALLRALLPERKRTKRKGKAKRSTDAA